MSQVRPKIDGWIGYGDGSSMLVQTDTLLDADHPLVTERPELFEAIAEPAAPPARRGRPPKAAPVADEATDG